MLRFLITSFFLIAPMAAHAADLTLESGTGHIIPVDVNGRTLMLRVDPGASGFIILNPGAAKRAGLKGSLVGLRVPIGPITLRGQTNRSKVGVGGVVSRMRVAWADRDVFAGADGLISPEAMPYETVTLKISPASPSAKTIDLPVSFLTSEGIHVRIKVGNEDVITRFSTVNPWTQATASAGAHIASEFGGYWKGPARRQVIKFGIERPVRPMALLRHLSLRGLSLDNFFVRTNDNRGSFVLPSDNPPDSDEIVVTAKVKSKQPRRLALIIGRDRLATCSSLTYRRLMKRMVLVC
jgi:hypothetical protein